MVGVGSALGGGTRHKQSSLELWLTDETDGVRVTDPFNNSSKQSDLDELSSKSTTDPLLGVVDSNPESGLSAIISTSSSLAGSCFGISRGVNWVVLGEEG